MSLQTDHGLAKALQRHVRPTKSDLHRLANDDVPAWHGVQDPSKRARHSPDEPGCTCRDQWVCPTCGHWHRTGGPGRQGRTAIKALELEAAAASTLDMSSRAAEELRPLLQPVLDEMTRNAYKAAVKAKEQAEKSGEDPANITTAKTASEPAPIAMAVSETELEGHVCHGCGATFPIPPPQPLCPFISRNDYYRGAGVYGGPGIVSGGRGSGVQGNDVVIKIQVSFSCQIRGCGSSILVQ